MTSTDRAFRVGFYSDDTSFNAGGIFPYTVRISRAIRNYTFADKLDVQILRSEREIRKGLDGYAGKVSRRLRETLAIALRREPLLPLAAKLELKAHGQSKIDLLHVPIQTPPFLGAPFICTMHDVQELHFPKFFTAKEREIRAVYHRMAIEEAKRIVVSFQHVKDDLVNYFDCDENKVAVIPIPFDQISLQQPDQELASSLAHRHSDLGKFFLYPAQTWEHKNHLRLISAFEQVAAQAGEKVSLVCTGHQNDFFEVIRSRISSSIVRDRIHFLGMVPEEELHWLYKQTTGVVVPSLYEAGSFPVMEAMTLSAPVICARTTSLPETIGCDDFTFDPLDESDMAAKMDQLLSNQSYASSCVSNCAERVAAFSNIKTCQHLEQLWLGVMDELPDR